MIRALVITITILLFPLDVFAADYELKIGTIATEDTPWGKHLKRFKKRVEDESDDRIKVVIFFAGSMGDEVSLVRQCKRGELEGIGVSTAPITTVVPEVGIFELPFAFDTLEEADNIIDNHLKDKIIDILEDNGFKLYFFSENGYRNFATKGVVIHTPSDLEPLKMRCQETWIHEEMYNAYNSNPVQMSVSEVLPALQSGAVDGFDNTPLWAFASSWYQAIDTWTVSNHIYQPAMILYNKKWFDSLPSDLQDILLKDPDLETKLSRKLVRKLNEKLVKNLEKANVTVYYMTEEERKVFRDKALPVWDKFGDLSSDAQELLDILKNAKGL